MGQDGEIGQGPHTQLKEQQQIEFELLLKKDRKAEKRLVRMEVLTLLAALGVVVLCKLAAEFL